MATTAAHIPKQKYPKVDVATIICCRDPRSDYYEDLYGDHMKDVIDEIPEPRHNCFCDNCFYGRDRLALEIIKLQILNDAQKEMLDARQVTIDTLLGKMIGGDGDESIID